jgi:hypothetical protein
MSLRHYHATAIDCDGCGDCYFDSCEVRDDLLLRFAQRDGWTQTEDGRHLCSTCSVKDQPQPADEGCSRSLTPGMRPR